jgi:endoglucanase Acf2
MAKRQITPEQIEETKIISETINPVIEDSTDVEIEMTPVPPNTEEGQLSKVIETNRFIESEILYETSNPDRTAWDLTDALIDLETIYSVERILDKDRFSDFGCDDPEKHELHPEDCCVIFSTAYPLGVILVEMPYEDITKILIAYKG